jgi:hypothetical protein
MNAFMGLLGLTLGVCMVIMVLRSLKTGGGLPHGSKGGDGTGEFRRDDHPLMYWVMFLVYGAGGLGITGYSLLVLIGRIKPVAG